ncbi:hypothetical protein GCM10018785_74500 [Streptomyces longispororuber]|uniref:Uncharacterized protein n=1 Tax=Streptomyces longispororuber TaxID=68230 RepID=A0A919ADM7_9ACTN|nr:hypothetical protein GCM10018785_74500 [Streptomyces longispororuber]
MAVPVTASAEAREKCASTVITRALCSTRSAYVSTVKGGPFAVRADTGRPEVIFLPGLSRYRGRVRIGHSTDTGSRRGGCGAAGSRARCAAEPLARCGRAVGVRGSG